MLSGFGCLVLRPSYQWNTLYSVVEEGQWDRGGEGKS